MSEPTPPPRRDRYEPIMVGPKARPDIDTFGAVAVCLIAFIAFGLTAYPILVVNILRDQGETQYARVSESAGRKVTVMLPAPVSREVDLDTWQGRPQVGTTIPVRYHPDHPWMAMEAGAPTPWSGSVPPFVFGLAATAVAWHVFTRHGRRLRRGEG
ncbi:hypothetical protein AB0J90_25510 [Micromonospora sp. NPDC049523]|uniref:hypothetical protein n=1 Tax=Micromonospora sp. NPDC049523 TaxID=3155921 RepID=UPI0034318AB2